MLSSARGVIRSTAPSAAPAGAPGHHSERGERAQPSKSPSRPTRRTRTHKTARACGERSRPRVSRDVYVLRGIRDATTVYMELGRSLRPACAEVTLTAVTGVSPRAFLTIYFLTRF